MAKYMTACPHCVSTRGVMVASPTHRYYFNFEGEPSGRVAKQEHEDKETALLCVTCSEKLNIDSLEPGLQTLALDIMEVSA